MIEQDKNNKKFAVPKIAIFIIFFFSLFAILMAFQSFRTFLCKSTSRLICVQTGPLYSDVQGYIDAQKRAQGENE